MKKALLAFAIIGFVACNNEATEEKTTTDTATAPVVADTTAPVVADTTKAADTTKPVVADTTKK
jgi:cytoskeletal protein RodZ